MERIYGIITDRGMSNNSEAIAAQRFKRKMHKFKVDPSTMLNGSNGNNVLSPRELYPELHDKTHFKAAYTLMLNNQSCLQTDYGK